MRFDKKEEFKNIVNALASAQLKSILCDGSLISGAMQWCFAPASAN